MLNAISFIIVGIIITCLFSSVRNFIFKKTIKTGFNASIGRKFKSTGEEVFEWKRFFSGFFALLDPIKWAKTLVTLFNIRNLIVFGIIFSVVFGYGYWKGQQGKPVKVNLNYSEAVEIKVPHSNLRLYKPKNSNQLYWIDKDGNKTYVKVEDLPALQKALKPYGIIFKPYFIGGIGTGKKNGFEGGVGTYFVKYYLWRLGSHITNKGIYLGVGYKLSGLGLKNTALNLSYGKGWSGDSRLLFGFTVNF
ncbi:hypothetical protein DRN73_07165 [Candidatus Pacearchaeota archaeon]|nr:MAG: hypothetical protein DRN73_07165 [Candidatus Pacearchaeota archaeon]